MKGKFGNLLFLMIRRPPRSTPKPSSAASDVYKRQSLPLLNDWQNYLSKTIRNDSEFKSGEKNEAIRLCVHLNSDNEIIDWSFHLTLVKCTLIVGSDHTEALLSRKSNQG